MRLSLNYSQRKVFSTFFNNIAVAWFIAAFVTPSIDPSVPALTYALYIVNMISALYLSLSFLEEEV